MIPRKKIFSLSLAHLLNDWYMNYLPTLLPFLVAAGLGIGKGAFLISAFTLTSSLLQPVFGYLVDQKNQRWMVYAGTLWMAVLLSAAAVIPHYFILLAAATLGGLGTAAFHPQASAMVTSVSGSKKGVSQAFFTAAGNVGWALTPLVVVPFVETWGLAWTPVFVLPGIFVAILLWLSAPRTATAVKKAPSPLLPALRAAGGELSKVMLVVAFRSLAYSGLIAFLPLYLTQQNISLLAGSRLLFVMLFAGALGGLAGGYLSDRVGRKTVIAGSLIAATPFFYLFLITGGVLSYIFMAIAGALLLASFSVTVVEAQEIISHNAALASGLTLGFGAGIGGLGVGLIGLFAEQAGISAAVHVLIWLPLVAGLLGLTLRGRQNQPASP